MYKDTHTPCLVRPLAEAPHPHACSFTDNTITRDAFKTLVSYKRACGHLVFFPVTDIIHTFNYTMQFSRSPKS